MLHILLLMDVYNLRWGLRVIIIEGKRLLAGNSEGLSLSVAPYAGFFAAQ